MCKLVEASDRLIEIERSLTALRVLVAANGEEYVESWAVVDLLDLNADRVREVIGLVDYLRGEGAGDGSAYERCLSEVMGD